MSESNPNDAAVWSAPLQAGEGQDSPSDSAQMQTLPRIVIAEALRNRWFEIWYQPKIDLKRKCLAGAEALARIRHPELGVLLPGSFLPGVDDESVAELARAGAGRHAVRLVDVRRGRLQSPSRHQCAGRACCSSCRSRRWSRSTGRSRSVGPACIVEVTEDQIVRDIALAQEIASQLRVSGITIAIDDFGAGYSSFSSLRELPFAELKLDRTFVQGLRDRRHQRRDLPDRDRSRASLRQRRGRRRHRDAGRPAGA